jgi:hypothetical protein
MKKIIIIKLKRFLLGSLAGSIIVGNILQVIAYYMGFKTSNEMFPFPTVYVFGAVIGAILGLSCGNIIIPKGLEYLLKNIIIWTFIGVLVTFVIPHAFCSFYVEIGGGLGHDGCMRFWTGQLRMRLLEYFVPACALGGLVVGLVKQNKNCKDSNAVNN